MSKILIVALTLLHTYCFALESATPLVAWSIKGKNPTYGSYTGTLKIVRDEANSAKLQAYRDITYDNYKFEGLSVEELWIGPADIGEKIIVQFDLSLKSFVASVDNVADTESNQTSVLKILLNNDVAEVQETTLSNGSAETLEPLGSGSLTYESFNISEMPLAKPLSGIWTSLVKLAKNFYNDSLVKKYSNNSKFKSAVHYDVRDNRNYNYYQTNKDTIRLVNAVASANTLMAEYLRQNAYAYTLREKADYIESQTENFSINEWGLLGLPQIDSAGKIITNNADMSTALWTGSYIASQSLRYRVTGEAAALDNIKKSIKGIFLLLDIVPDKTRFARSIRRVGEYKNNEEWVKAEGDYSGLEYHSRGNTDMLRGIVIALVAADDALGDQAEWKEAITAHAKRLLSIKLQKRAKSSSELMIAGAVASITKDKNDIKRVEKILASPGFAIGNIALPKQRGAISDWSGNYLGLVKDMLRTDFAKKTGNSKLLESSLKSSLRDWEQIKQFKTSAVHTFFLAGEKVIDKEKEKASLEHAMWSLREFPRGKPTRAFTIDYTALDNFVLSPYPSLPWKYLDKKRTAAEGYQSLYSYPLFASTASFSNWTWRSNPFTFKGGNAGGVLVSSADYLFAYWLARYYQLIDQNE